MILDSVVGAAGKETRDGGPLVPVKFATFNDDFVLLRSEVTMLHVRAELVAPSQPARLAAAPRNASADEGPVPRAELVHQFRQCLVFFSTPRPLHDILTRHRVFTEKLASCYCYYVNIFANCFSFSDIKRMNKDLVEKKLKTKKL